MSKIRFDQWVQSQFPELSRSKVKSLIERGKVEILQAHWRIESKPGLQLDSESLSELQVRLLSDEEIQYVSRGALKLKRAIEEFKISLSGRICLDVGLSTGGFSDYLLQRNALKVLGIDVGREQLHPSLKSNPKLFYRDKVNGKEPLPQDLLQNFFGEAAPFFDLIVIDVSFISLTKLIPNLVNYLKPQGVMVGLIKPQFELSRRDLNKKGVVKDPQRSEDAIEKVLGVLMENKLEIIGTCPSPIEGENGNKEHLFVSRQSNINKPVDFL